MAANHRPWHILLILVTFAALILTIVLHFAGSATGRKLMKIPDDWFIHDSEDLDRKYMLKVSPDPWMTYVWVVVYFMQVLWMTYALSLICRPTADRQAYLYYQGFVPLWLFLVFLMNLICNLGYTFAYDRDVQIVATTMRFLITTTLVICMALTYSYLGRRGKELLLMGQSTDVYLVRAFIHNGLALYLGWNSFNASLNLGANFYFQYGLSMTDSCTIGLSVIALQILIYAPLDMLMLDRYMRYTFTPYFAIIIGMAGIVIKSYEQWERNTVIACVILAVTVVAFGFKVGFTLLRRRRWPEPLLYPTKGNRKSTVAPQMPAPRQYVTPQPTYPWIPPQPQLQLQPQPQQQLQPQPVYGIIQPQPQPQPQPVYGIVQPQTTPQQLQWQSVNASPMQPVIYQTIPTQTLRL